MKHMKTLIFILSLFAIQLAASLSALDYTVQFKGTQDRQLLKTMGRISKTADRSQKSVPGYSVLKRQAEDDITRLRQAAHFHGYFSASISYTITAAEPPCLIFHIETGPLYSLSTFTALTANPNDADLITPYIKPFTPDAVASTKNMFAHEKALLKALKNNGYQKASIIHRITHADIEHHTIHYSVTVDPGVKFYFQEPVIQCTGSIKNERIFKCVTWRPGEVYSYNAIKTTKLALENCHLFSFVSIQEQETAPNEITPIIILEEAPHHTVGAGLSYTSVKGPGIAIDWEDRNLRQLGEKLSLRADLWKRFQTISATLQQQDLFRPGETLNWITEYNRQELTAFSSKNISIGVSYDTTLNDYTDMYYGARLENLHTTQHKENERYYITKLPLGYKYNSTNTISDPTSGSSLHIKLTPAYQFRNKDFCYITHTTTFSTFYSPYSERITLAIKAVFGNIIGAGRNTIPLPDRFFSGSENMLRGYKYQTVSPLNKKREPIGGRSLLVGSCETRIRFSETMGGVVFFDIGNVYKQNMPDRHAKQLRSLGVGGRYTTPIGPLRLDIAFPLDRRKKLDSRFQFYFSIGHAF